MKFTTPLYYLPLGKRDEERLTTSALFTVFSSGKVSDLRNEIDKDGVEQGEHACNENSLGV